MSEFRKEVGDRISAMNLNADLKAKATDFLKASVPEKYSYNFSWMGRPIIQYPQDIVAMQEIIWEVRPDLIIETGIAHGGSLIFSASMLRLLDLANAVETGHAFDPRMSKRSVLGIDIDIREHNRRAIEHHPLASSIQMIQGSSLASDVVNEVHQIASRYQRILVCLDSNHTHDHVLSELQNYAQLTSVGSYCVVFDTLIEDMPDDSYPDRPWGPGDNPKTAVWKYLQDHPEFEVDRNVHEKLLITVAQGGYLKRTY